MGTVKSQTLHKETNNMGQKEDDDNSSCGSYHWHHNNHLKIPYNILYQKKNCWENNYSSYASISFPHFTHPYTKLQRKMVTMKHT